MKKQVITVHSCRLSMFASSNSWTFSRRKLMMMVALMFVSSFLPNLVEADKWHYKCWLPRSRTKNDGNRGFLRKGFLRFWTGGGRGGGVVFPFLRQQWNIWNHAWLAEGLIDSNGFSKLTLQLWHYSHHSLKIFLPGLKGKWKWSSGVIIGEKIYRGRWMAQQDAPSQTSRAFSSLVFSQKPRIKDSCIRLQVFFWNILLTYYLLVILRDQSKTEQ